MKRAAMSKYDQLPFLVECKSTYPFWETIAAFNSEVVARRYAEDCQQANRSYEYRVQMMLGAAPLSSGGAL